MIHGEVYVTMKDISEKKHDVSTINLFTDQQSEKHYGLDNNEKLIITKYIILKLFSDDKTVRDPVHGDILWNHLETCIINTESFQRLRRIRQLGTAHFVYPGAEHSRFQHSIGTLYAVQVLLQNVTANERFSDYTVFSDNPLEDLRKLQDITFKLVVRASALLHDCHEFPLSHTLEKEGNLFKEQWVDKHLNYLILGKDSEIFSAISNYISSMILNIESFLHNLDEFTTMSAAERDVFTKLTSIDATYKFELAQRITRTILVLIYATINEREKNLRDISKELFKNDEIIENLVDEKFLGVGSQMVANTICADLLDYLKRDFYFCGIEKTYDKRFLKYAVVCKHPVGKKDEIVFGYRVTNRRGEVKSSVLSALFDLLELRYSLAELVHTHKTKNAFSVMAIEAFNYYFQSLNDNDKKEFGKRMLKMGDDELLTFIRDNYETSKYILDYYFQRHPYIEYALWDFDDLTSSGTSDVISYLRDSPRERCYLESLLSKSLSKVLDADIREGDCLIYLMPQPQKLYKEIDAYVIFSWMKSKERIVSTLSSLGMEKELNPYQRLPYGIAPIIKRIRHQRDNLITRYGNLWHASLFLSPKIGNLTDSVKMNTIRGSVFALIMEFCKDIGHTVNIRPAEFGELITSPELLELVKSTEQKLSSDARGFKGGTFEEIYQRVFTK